MPDRTDERPTTSAEHALLERMLQDAATGARRWKQGAGNALVLWAASMLALVLAWLGLAWLARTFFQMEFGLRSPAAVWVVGVGAAACALVAIVSSVRWIRGWRDYRPLLHADLEGGRVIEEHYEFAAAKRFQEPEHGGLIYFLRTNDDRVLALFDHESQELGVRDEDPLKSSFEARTQLVMVRAPKTRFVIGKQFSGALLDAGAPVELGIEPRLWPESEEYCAIPWNELESRLRGGAQER